MKTGDYEGFYEHEIALRKQRRYPPFIKLALIRLSYPWDWKDGQSRVNAFAAALRAHGRSLGLTVLGPAPAPLARIQGRMRFQCLMKARHLAARASGLRHGPCATSARCPHELRITLDLDPVNML